MKELQHRIHILFQLYTIKGKVWTSGIFESYYFKVFDSNSFNYFLFNFNFIISTNIQPFMKE